MRPRKHVPLSHTQRSTAISTVPWTPASLVWGLESWPTGGELIIFTTQLYCTPSEHASTLTTTVRIQYRAVCQLATRYGLASAQQRALAAGVLVILWTLEAAERHSRVRGDGMECAHGPRAAVRQLSGRTQPDGRVRSTAPIEGLRKGVASAIKRWRTTVPSEALQDLKF